MKKILTIFLVTVLFVGALAVPALAARSASMSVTSSQSTLNKGDTFTVTVSTTAVVACTSGGYMFSFDKNAFEYVSGTSLSALSGFTAGVSTAGGNVAGYFMNGNATVQGATFQITLRVKDTAPAGEYVITGTPNMTSGSTTLTCYTGGARVTVACNHSYGSWTNDGTGTHSRTCSLCSHQVSGIHVWNNENVTKQPTCREEGSKTATCQVCNATESVVLPKTTTHTYSSWSEVDNVTHHHACNVCEITETANHTWEAKVTKQATCREEGLKLLRCTGCQAEKTEIIPALTTHTYDNGCDHDCNTCGVTRTIRHSYKSSWSGDKNNHWHECSVCKNKKDVEAHTPGADATETKAQTCTTCGYVLKAALGHKHCYETSWTIGNDGHWYTCSGCEEKGSYTAHSFENACDGDCSTCGYTRETNHEFTEAWDANNHWHLCTVCDLKQDVAAHEPGAEATETTAQVCTLCDYEITPALGVEEIAQNTESIDASNPSTPAEQNTSAKQNLPLWVSIAAAAVAIVSIAVFLVIKTKKP